MSGSRSSWDQRIGRTTKDHQGSLVDYILVAMLLIVMTAMEVQFLYQVAGPDSVSLIQAADGILPPDQIGTDSDWIVARF